MRERESLPPEKVSIGANMKNDRAERILQFFKLSIKTWGEKGRG